MDARIRNVSSESVRETLEQVLGCYELGSLLQYQRARSGYVNDNWIVDTPNGRFFLKCRHPNLCDPQAIRAQHALMFWLHEAGFPTPALLPTQDGDTLLMLGGQCWESQHFIKGELCDRFDSEQAAVAAQTLGQYHQIVSAFGSAGLASTQDRFHPSQITNTIGNISTAWEAQGGCLPASILGLLTVHVADLEARFASHGELPCLVVHGDYHGDNLLLDKGMVVGVLDFDRASFQPRASEIAEALIYFSSPSVRQLKRLDYPGVLEWTPLAAFLAAYASSASLTEREVQALPDYIRCIWIQMSLRHPLRGLLRPGDYLALEETLLLADWARDNCDHMVQIALDASSPLQS